MSKRDVFINSLEMLGDGRLRYYDGGLNSVGCSKYIELALIRAGIIKQGETFHAASGNPGVLEDKSRFQKIEWDPYNLQRADIMFSSGCHVAVWDGSRGVFEAAPEKTHGICANGKTGVGHWPYHGYRNCGNGTFSWTCLYRIIDIQKVAEEIKEVTMDKKKNVETLIEFLPVVQKGSRCNTVKALQKIMQKYGWYQDSIDGIAGPNTVNGIKLLQTAIGVPADGICGPQTWTKLLLD